MTAPPVGAPPPPVRPPGPGTGHGPGDGLNGIRPARRRPSIARLVAVEAVAVAVGLAAWNGSVVLLAATAVVSVIVLVAVFGRSRELWWTDVVTLRRAWRRRRATGSFIPRVVVGHDDRGTNVGIGCDAEGWYAAVAVRPGDGVEGRLPAELPVAALAALVADDTVPVSTIQITTLTVPTPQYLMDPQSTATRSYHALANDLVGAFPPPIEQHDWIAVRLNSADAVSAAHDRGGGIVGVHRALAATVGRVTKSLTAAGLAGEVLGPMELATAVLFCGGVPGAAPDGPPGEEWSSWSSGALADVAFEIREWPADSARMLTSALLSTPAARMVYALELRPARRRAASASAADPTVVAVRGVVRVAAVSSQLADCVAALTKRATGVGIRLRRLDGWHGPAAYASAPTGGDPR